MLTFALSLLKVDQRMVGPWPLFYPFADCISSPKDLSATVINADLIHGLNLESGSSQSTPIK